MIHFLILLLAAALRMWGIGFGLPDLFHADEPVVVNHALQYASGDLNPHFFNIPPFSSYLLSAVYGLLFIAGKAAGLWRSSGDFAQLFFKDPSLFYYMGRFFLGVLPSVATVHFLMRWLESTGAAPKSVYRAGFLLAVCFIHVSDAHYIYADMMLLLVSVILFYFLSRSDLSRVSSHLIAGALIGSAAAVKYNGCFLAAAYLWFALDGQKNFKGMAAAFFASIAGFAVLNPYAFLDFNFFLSELNEQNAANQGVPIFHHLVYSAAEGMGWPVLLLSAAGFIFAWTRNNRDMKASAFFCIVYYLVLWRKGQEHGRYILPLIPFLTALAVFAWECFSRKNHRIRWLATGVLILGIAGNAAKSIAFDLIMSRSDVRSRAAEWIAANIPTGSSIALDGAFFSPRLNWDCASLEEKNKKLNPASKSELMRLNAKLEACSAQPGYKLAFLSDNPGSNRFLFANPELSWNFSALAKQKVQYVVFIPETHQDGKHAEVLQRSANLIQIWSPYKRDSALTVDKTILTGGPFTWAELFLRRENGYKIELYQLPAAAKSARTR